MPMNMKGMVIDMQSNYLIHYGILGQKWGVRRFENEDGSLTAAGKERYSSDQYRRDRAVYGKSGANRIQKNVDKGDSVSGARSKEASRINSTRARARTAGQVGRTVGSVAGAIGGYYASKAVRQALALKYDVLNDPPTFYGNRPFHCIRSVISIKDFSFEWSTVYYHDTWRIFTR